MRKTNFPYKFWFCRQYFANNSSDSVKNSRRTIKYANAFLTTWKSIQNSFEFLNWSINQLFWSYTHKFKSNLIDSSAPLCYSLASRVFILSTSSSSSGEFIHAHVPFRHINSKWTVTKYGIVKLIYILFSVYCCSFSHIPVHPFMKNTLNLIRSANKSLEL